MHQPRALRGFPRPRSGGTALEPMGSRARGRSASCGLLVELREVPCSSVLLLPHFWGWGRAVYGKLG